MHHPNVHKVQHEGTLNGDNKKQHSGPVHHLQLPTIDPGQQLAPVVHEDFRKDAQQV